MNKKACLFFILLVVLPLYLFAQSNGVPGESVSPADSSLWPWWVWSLLLFVFCFLVGIVSVMAGIGGGVLFVPLVGTFFPFHLDFVRGASLMVSLSTALASSPALMRKGLVSFRLVLPMALAASFSALAGARVGLMLDQNMVRIFLGCCIFFILLLMFFAKKSEHPEVKKPDRLSQLLGMYGIYYESSLDREVRYQVHRTGLGLVLFLFVGFLAGMFGLGAGWANVPVFNLVLGAPLKVAVGSSLFLLSISDTAAAWVYLHRGAIDVVLTVPSVLGIILGSKVGVKLLTRAKPGLIRYLVLVLLAFAGISSILKGLFGFLR